KMTESRIAGALAVLFVLSTPANAQSQIGSANTVSRRRVAVLLARFRLEAAFMPMRQSRPAVAAKLVLALLKRPVSMLGLHQLYVLTSLSTTQARALAASSLMLRRARLDSRLVHRVRAITKSRPRMAFSEFEARSDAEGET